MALVSMLLIPNCVIITYKYIKLENYFMQKKQVHLPDNKSQGFKVYRFARIYTELLERQQDISEQYPLKPCIEVMRGQIAMLKERGPKGFSDAVKDEVESLEDKVKELEKSGLEFFAKRKREQDKDVKFYRDALSATVEACANDQVFIRNKAFVIDTDSIGTFEGLSMHQSLSCLFDKYDIQDKFNVGINKTDGLVVKFPGYFSASELAFNLVRDLKSEYPDIKVFGYSDNRESISNGIDLSSAVEHYATYWKALDGHGKKASEGIFREAFVDFAQSYEMVDPLKNLVNEDSLNLQLLQATDFIANAESQYEQAYRQWEDVSMRNDRVDWNGIHSQL